MNDAKKIANDLMKAHEICRSAARAIWVGLHRLTEWECGDCGHGGTGEELDCESDGTPMCPWCCGYKVKPRESTEDVVDEADIPVVNEADTSPDGNAAFFVGEFSAWMDSMQDDGYATDDIARVVKAECEVLLGGK
jgi:hypothetical protein